MLFISIIIKFLNIKCKIQNKEKYGLPINEIKEDEKEEDNKIKDLLLIEVIKNIENHCNELKRIATPYLNKIIIGSCCKSGFNYQILIMKLIMDYIIQSNYFINKLNELKRDVEDLNRKYISNNFINYEFKNKVKKTKLNFSKFLNKKYKKDLKLPYFIVIMNEYKKINELLTSWINSQINILNNF